MALGEWIVRAIFLDRDGVINENRADYVKSWAEFRWLPGTRDAMLALARLDVPIIVVTNQSMIGRGLVSVDTLDDLHYRMRAQILAWGGRLDGVYACVHSPDERCICRKPLPGLLEIAATQHRVSLAQSVLIGDAFTDFQAATAAGARYIHVRSGRGQAEASRLIGAGARVPVVPDLRAAATLCTAHAAPWAPMITRRDALVGAAAAVA